MEFFFEGLMPKNRQMQEQGWSLTELLIVLAIMGIVTMLAGPSYQTLTVRVQARSTTAEIASGVSPPTR